MELLIVDVPKVPEHRHHIFPLVKIVRWRAPDFIAELGAQVLPLEHLITIMCDLEFVGILCRDNLLATEIYSLTHPHASIEIDQLLVDLSVLL